MFYIEVSFNERIDVRLNINDNELNFKLSGMGLIYGKNSDSKENNRYTTIGHTLGMYL